MQFFAAISITSVTAETDKGSVFTSHDAGGNVMQAECPNGETTYSSFTAMPLPVGTQIIIRGIPTNTGLFPTVVTEVLEVVENVFDNPQRCRFLRNVTHTVALVGGFYPSWSASQAFLIYRNEASSYDIENVNVTKSLRFETQLHGGFSGASFKLYGTKEVVSDRLTKLLNCDVTITDGYGRVAWEGFVTSTTLEDETVLGVTCSGYYAKAGDIFYDRIFASYEATVNLLKNPSFEYATLNWGVITEAPVSIDYPLLFRTGDTSNVPFGSYFMRVVQPLASYYNSSLGIWLPNTSDCSAYYDFSVGNIYITGGTSYTFSFYARSVGLTGVPYVQVYSGGIYPDNNVFGQQMSGLDTTWRRFAFTFVTRADVSYPEFLRLVINVPNTASNGSVGYLDVDGVQLEAKAYATPYCDGTMPGCTWFDPATPGGRTSRSLIPVYARTVFEEVTELIPTWQHNTTFFRFDETDVGSYNFTDKRCRDALEYACAYGVDDTETIPSVPVSVYFTIYQHRIPYLIKEPAQNGNLSWKSTVWSLTAYGVANHASLSLDTSGIFNKVYAVYNNIVDGPSLTMPAEDLLSQERYGVCEGKLQNADYPCRDNLNCAVRDVALDKYKYPRATVTLDITGKVEFSGGFIDEAYRIKAGHLILLSDVDVMKSNTGSMPGQRVKRLWLVLKTSYDATANSCQVDLGASDVAYDVKMSRLGFTGGL